jgi:hypothetical protein
MRPHRQEHRGLNPLSSTRKSAQIAVISSAIEQYDTIVCEPCGRRGRYNVDRLIAEHGDAKLTDLLATLANCPKARAAASTTDARRCTRGFDGRTIRPPRIRQ